jgi:hypothetical protein
MRGTYALARVVVIRATVARTLLWIGVVGMLAGLLIPSVTGRRHGVMIGAAAGLLAALAGLLLRSRWYRARIAAADKAAFAVTLEPPQATRRRLARDNALGLLIGMIVVCAAAVAAAPAAGMVVFGYGFGLFVATRLTARWERVNETLVWARTEDARLLGRRSRIGPFATTGPAGGQVRPVVKGASRTRG